MINADIIVNLQACNLCFKTGASTRAFRVQFNLHRDEFSGVIGVCQSAGSQYESGKTVPDPILLLLNIAYGNRQTAAAIVEHLRRSVK